MNIKHILLTLIIGFFSQAYGMQENIQDNNSIFQIINLTPEDIKN